MEGWIRRELGEPQEVWSSGLALRGFRRACEDISSAGSCDHSKPRVVSGAASTVCYSDWGLLGQLGLWVLPSSPSRGGHGWMRALPRLEEGRGLTTGQPSLCLLRQSPLGHRRGAGYAPTVPPAVTMLCSFSVAPEDLTGSSYSRPKRGDGTGGHAQA